MPICYYSRMRQKVYVPYKFYVRTTLRKMQKFPFCYYVMNYKLIWTCSYFSRSSRYSSIQTVKLLVSTKKLISCHVAINRLVSWSKLLRKNRYGVDHVAVEVSYSFRGIQVEHCGRKVRKRNKTMLKRLKNGTHPVFTQIIRNCAHRFVVQT